MKYIPCCEIQCPVKVCEIKEDGGCLCVCKLSKEITELQAIVNGIALCHRSGVLVYAGNDETVQKKHYNSMSESDKRYNNKMRTKIAPDRLEILQHDLSKYEKTSS